MPGSPGRHTGQACLSQSSWSNSPQTQPTGFSPRSLASCTRCCGMSVNRKRQSILRSPRPHTSQPRASSYERIQKANVQFQENRWYQGQVKLNRLSSVGISSLPSKPHTLERWRPLTEEAEGTEGSLRPHGRGPAAAYIRQVSADAMVTSAESYT